MTQLSDFRPVFAALSLPLWFFSGLGAAYRSTADMQLGQISYLDCLVFLIFLAPQLLIEINLIELLSCVIQALPFFLFKLPYQIIRERVFTARRDRSPFVRQASVFQDFVIRCVRYAFAYFPAKIGRVFFSKGVALPFMRFRMLRHGYLHPPLPWREVQFENTSGLFMITDETQKPDLVILYCHGGGFSMGSSFFYLEFLLAWTSFLKESGYRNPAILGLEYDLVPDASYPVQLHQTIAGYDYCCSLVDNPSKVCVSGDSAGATLVLSLLLHNAQQSDYEKRRPGFATLISPWTTLFSVKNRNTPSDYLNSTSLHLYGLQYAGSIHKLDDPLVSPGMCKDTTWWAKASPRAGFSFLYGSEEVLGPELRELIALLRQAGVAVSVREEPGSIHAWPVVTMFLSDTQIERQRGLKDLTRVVRQAIAID